MTTIIMNVLLYIGIKGKAIAGGLDARVCQVNKRGGI